MTDFSFRFKPINSLGLEQENLLGEYNAKMKDFNLSSAVNILDNAQAVGNEGGIRACLMNKIKNMILEVETYLLNLSADNETIYSITEPTEYIDEKIYWIQPISIEVVNEMKVLRCNKHIRKIIDGILQYVRVSEWQLADDVQLSNGSTIQTSMNLLTDGNKVTEIKFVDTLPENAADYPTTLFITEN